MKGNSSSNPVSSVSGAKMLVSGRVSPPGWLRDSANKNLEMNSEICERHVHRKCLGQ